MINSIDEKIPTWEKTECRGIFRYVVRKIPLRIAFSPRKCVFEPNVVGIFSKLIVQLTNENGRN